MSPQQDDLHDSHSPGDGNPFSADLNSGFGTSAVGATQLFKEGGFASESRTKILLGILGALVVVAGGYYWWSGGEPTPPHNPNLVVADEENEEDMPDHPDQANKALAPKHEVAKKPDALPPAPPKHEAAQKTDLKKDAKDLAAKHKDDMAEEPIQEDHSHKRAMKASGKLTSGLSIENYQSELGSKHSRGPKTAPVLSEPQNGFRLRYDETTHFAELKWQGGGGTLVLSRSPDMNPADETIKVHGNSYRLHKPYPGRWYWQVKNRAGTSQIGTFDILGPVRRAVSLMSPKDGETLAQGGTVHWTGDTKVSFYRVEFTQNEWTNPSFRFATAGTQLAIHSVPPGTYSMRLGAFSESAGRWEYSAPIKVTVQ